MPVPVVESRSGSTSNADYSGRALVTSRLRMRYSESFAAHCHAADDRFRPKAVNREGGALDLKFVAATQVSEEPTIFAAVQRTPAAARLIRKDLDRCQQHELGGDRTAATQVLGVAQCDQCAIAAIAVRQL